MSSTSLWLSVDSHIFLSSSTPTAPPGRRKRFDWSQRSRLRSGRSLLQIQHQRRRTGSVVLAKTDFKTSECQQHDAHCRRKVRALSKRYLNSPDFLNQTQFYSFHAPAKSTSDRSSMAVLELSLPSGFVVDAASLESLKSTIDTIKKVETKNDETLAVIYFDHLTKDPISLKINGFRNHLVSEQKPVPIVVYDYYDNGKMCKSQRHFAPFIHRLIFFSALNAREFYLPDGI